MARKKKDGRYLNTKIKASLMDKLEHMSDKSGMSKTAIVENALDYYFRHNKTVNDMFRNLKK